MFYRKSLLTKTARTSEISFDDFSGGMNPALYNISASHARLCFNVEGKDGALKQWKGFDRPRLGASVFYPEAQEVFCPREVCKIAAAGKDGKIYVFKGENFEEICSFGGKVCFADFKKDGNYCLLIFDDSGIRIYDGQSVSTVTSDVKIERATVFKERIFGISREDDTKIYFSKPLDCLNWASSFEEGGFVCFDDNFGRVFDIGVFEDRLYAFGNGKIAALYAGLPQSEFEVEKIFASGGRTVKNSVSNCGCGLVFLTSDGLYLFDGSGSEKICGELDGFISGKHAVSVCDGSNYYLACLCDFGDHQKVLCEKGNFFNNALICVNTEDFSVKIARGVDISSLALFEDQEKNSVLFAERGQIGYLSESGSYFGQNLPKIWRTACSDLGYPTSKKCLKNLFLLTTSDVEVKIMADGVLHSFSVKGKETPQKVKIGVSGVNLRISFETNSPKFLILKPTFTMEIYKEG